MDRNIHKPRIPMKIRTLLIAIICLIGLISCEKVEFRKDISGLWQCDGVGGGYVSSWYEPYNFTHIKLKRNYQYSIYNYDTLKISGKYSMSDYENYNGKYFEPYLIKLSNNNDLRISFPFNQDLQVTIINNDTLILGDRNDDGLQYYFTRK
jgi:hypothetical protein